MDRSEANDIGSILELSKNAKLLKGKTDQISYVVAFSLAGITVGSMVLAYYLLQENSVDQESGESFDEDNTLNIEENQLDYTTNLYDDIENAADENDLSEKIVSSEEYEHSLVHSKNQEEGTDIDKYSKQLITLGNYSEVQNACAGMENQTSVTKKEISSNNTKTEERNVNDVIQDLISTISKETNKRSN